MPNGTIGDHPPTDILFHKVEVYGREADETIRKISESCSWRELLEWWDREIPWSSETPLVLAKSKSRLAELLQGAKESGWEVDSEREFECNRLDFDSYTARLMTKQIKEFKCNLKLR